MLVTKFVVEESTFIVLEMKTMLDDVRLNMGLAVVNGTSVATTIVLANTFLFSLGLLVIFAAFHACPTIVGRRPVTLATSP